VVLQPVGLPFLARPIETQPGEVALDRGLVVRLAALQVGVVEAQDEGPAVAPRIESIEQRRAHVPHVQKPDRAGRETDNGM
jgi:hypothetical protein